MATEIPLRCAFVASRSTRTQLSTAVTRHVSRGPRALVSTAAVFALGVVVFAVLRHDVVQAVLISAIVTLVAALVEAGRAWVAAYRSLAVVGASGALTRSGFAPDRMRLCSEESDLVHPYTEIAALEVHGQFVFVRTHTTGQRWFVHPRALFPDPELNRIRAAIGLGPAS